MSLSFSILSSFSSFPFPFFFSLFFLSSISSAETILSLSSSFPFLLSFFFLSSSSVSAEAFLLLFSFSPFSFPFPFFLSFFFLATTSSSAELSFSFCFFLSFSFVFFLSCKAKIKKDCYNRTFLNRNLFVYCSLQEQNTKKKFFK